MYLRITEGTEGISHLELGSAAEGTDSLQKILSTQFFMIVCVL